MHFYVPYASYVTAGIIFGIINVIGYFGTVFCDQSYWQVLSIHYYTKGCPPQSGRGQFQVG